MKCNQTGPFRFPLTRGLFAGITTVAAVSAFLLIPSQVNVSAQVQVTTTPAPQPTPTFDPARLDKPPVSDSPTQLELGSLKYWGMCMACHGDRGQGLTGEWRDAYGSDRDCWQSGCHGSDRPPEAFLIPRDKLAPAIAGAGKLARFDTAQELQKYILKAMPWWKPGSLTDDEAWQAAAYVLKLHKVLPEGYILSPATASAIPVDHAVTAPGDQSRAILFFVGVVILGTIGWIARDTFRKKYKNKAADKPNFFHHLHPPTIPAAQARLRYTLGAGGLAVFFSLILLATGILEMFYYTPVPERAAISVQTITFLVPFGGLTRNLHYWSAQALVFVMFIHLIRVVLTGAYARRRRLNYLIGLGMLVLILLLDFTGYVLRWDEGIRWALVVGTSLLKTIPIIGDSIYLLVVGGARPGDSSIERFYTWHIFALTLGMVILGVWHIFRTRRDGGIAVPPPVLRDANLRITRFELVRREVLVMLIAGTGLLLISILLPAPIQAPIIEFTGELGDARAPWFFLWVQELLKLGDPFVWGVLTPVLILAILAILPYVFPEAADSELGHWLPSGNRIAQWIVILLLFAFLILTLLSIIPIA